MLRTVNICLLISFLCLSEAAGQVTPARTTTPAARQGPPSWSQRAKTRNPYVDKKNRKLAPWVMKSVDSELKIEDSRSRHDITEVKMLNGDFSWTKDITFRHDLWALKFEFKPVRMIRVDVPRSGGMVEPNKLIWYLVYRVTNTGKTIVPKPAQYSTEDIQNLVKSKGTVTPDPKAPRQPTHAIDGFTTAVEAKGILFIPKFRLFGSIRTAGDPSKFSYLSYSDQIIPAARIAIEDREKQDFYNTAEMCRRIEPGQSIDLAVGGAP